MVAHAYSCFPEEMCGLIAGVFWFVFARLLGVGLGPALPWLI